MSDLNTEIKIGADASGVGAGVSQAKRSLKDLGDSAKKAGQDAGAGIGAIGAGGDKAAKDVERAAKNIEGQLQRAIASFEAGERGSRQFYESIARQRGVDSNSLKPLLDQLDAVKAKSEEAAKTNVKLGDSYQGLGTAAGIAGRALAAIGIATSVRDFIKLADASTNIASKLGLVTSSAADLASVQQRLFTVAQSSRVSFVDLVGTYAQLARSTKELGVSQDSLLGVVKTVSQAVTISGGSAESARAALTQLSQGFASGALRGDELNSVLEQTPRLAQAIADGLGVSIGKLRELGAAGELTAEKVLGALEKSAGSVSNEFGKMALTVEQSSTQAANSVLKLAGAFDKLTGASTTLSGGISLLSRGIDALTVDVEKLGSQGALRTASREVLRLDEAARNLRTGMKNGVFNPNAQSQLESINAQLAIAKQRFRDLDKELGGIKDPRDQTGFTGRGTSYETEAKRQVKLSDDLNKFRLNLAGVPAGYTKEMAELIRLNQAGVLVGKEYNDALKKQQDELLKKTGVTKASNAAANQEQNTYESLIASIRAKIEADKLELAGGTALTESQRIRIKLDQDLAAGRIKLGSLRETEVRLAIEELATSEASVLAFKTLAKANLDAAASREKYVSSLAAGIDKIKADIAAQNEATQRMGLSKEAIADLDAAKLEMLATDTELQAIKALDRNLDQQTYDALKTQAQLYRDLAVAKKGGAAKETALDLEKANKDAAKKAQEEWERAAEDINRSLTDALLRGFESGKDFAKNLRDTVVNMFKTLVLRPIISAVVNPVAGAITGALGLSGAANAGSSALSTAGSIGSGYSALSGIGGAFGGGLSGGFGGLMGSLGLSATGSTFGGALSAGGIALQSGNILGGLGTLVGALGPIALGIGALAAIFGKDDSGTYHTGGAGSYSAAGGASTGAKVLDQGLTFGVRYKDYNSQAEGAAVGISQSIVGMLDATAKSFGNQAGYFAATAFADDSSKDGAWGSLIIKRLDDTVTNWADTQTSKWAPKVFADGEAGQKEYAAALAMSVRDALVGAVEGVDWAQSLLTGLGDAPTLEGLQGVVASINAAQEAFKGFGQYMPVFTNLTQAAVSGLVAASGSVQALTANMGTFVENFYSDSEKLAINTQNVTTALAALGIQMPKTREAFRDLVQSQLALGDAGAATVAGLLSLSGAFAAVTQASKTAEEVEAELAKARADARSSAYSALERAISAEKQALQSQLDVAQDVASTLGDLFDILHSNVRDLYSEVDSTRAMQASQGSDFINQALAVAKASGYLPDADKLSEAISAARGGINAGAYASQFAADRDRLVLAGKLSGLEEIAGKQLTDAQRTVRELETHTEQFDKTLDYWRQQIDIASGTYEGVLSVAAAVSQLSNLLGGGVASGGGGGGSGGGGGGGGSGPAIRDRGTVARADYGVDVALSDFSKFKAWYQGLSTNANVGALQSEGYQVPDWMRMSGMLGTGSEENMFGTYLYFKNNPQFATDFEQVMTTGRSSLSTDGSTLVRSDMSKMPTDVANYFKGDQASLLSYEGFGLDPVLAYKLYTGGPEQFGLDIKRENFTEWLRTHKWTEGGIVESNNTLDTAKPYAGYNLSRRDPSSGNIVDLDGKIYSSDGKYLGTAGADLMNRVYGAAFVGSTGGSYGATTNSALYNQQLGAGSSAQDYYSAIKSNLDAAIAGGMSAQGIADAISQTGASMQDVANAYGITVAQLAENLSNGGATNIPKFDVGTNYVPRDMLAYIHEGEAVVPKAYNPAAGGGASGGDGRVAALIEQLIAEVAELKAAAAETAGNTRPLPQLGRQFDTVSNGGTVLRNKAVA